MCYEDTDYFIGYETKEICSFIQMDIEFAFATRRELFECVKICFNNGIPFIVPDETSTRLFIHKDDKSSLIKHLEKY